MGENIIMNNYTDDVKKCLENAENLSKFTGCLLESIHLLVGLTEDQTYLSAKILSKMGFNYLIAKSFLIKTTFIQENNTTIISPVARSILNYAEKIAKNNNRTVDTQHILLSITYHKNCVASKILNRFNINYETISQIIEGININSNIKKMKKPSKSIK